jgi:hypothetical protein
MAAIGRHLCFCRLLRCCSSGVVRPKPRAGRVVVFPDKFDAEIVASDIPGGNQRRAGATEGVKDQTARFAECLYDRRKDTYRLLRRMEAVASVAPVEDVRQWTFRCLHLPIRQKVGLLVLMPQQAYIRRIAFAKHEMTNRPKSGFAPGFHEQVDLVPTVEADAEAALLEDATHFVKGGFEPPVVVVIGDGTSTGISISGDVGRIGEDEVDALGLKVAQTRSSVATTSSPRSLNRGSSAET